MYELSRGTPDLEQTPSLKKGTPGCLLCAGVKFSDKFSAEYCSFFLALAVLCDFSPPCSHSIGLGGPAPGAARRSEIALGISLCARP